MTHLNQYLRDLYTLMHSDVLKHKFYFFFFYNYLCFKNIIGKIFGIKFKSQKFNKFTIYFDNFNAFFSIFTELFIYNIYHFETKKEKPFIVDCGGNIGMAVLYFKYLYPKAIIECYEPDKETFAILEKNVKNNKLFDVKCLNEAVSGEPGELDFYSFGDMEGGPGNTLEKSQVNFKNVHSYKVKVVTLSQKKYGIIDFLKIDIEGSEGKVFHDLVKSGMIKNIERFSLEYHYDFFSKENSLAKIVSILEENKFNIIVNVNTLVDFYITEIQYNKLHKKYVLMLNCFK